MSGCFPDFFRFHIFQAKNCPFPVLFPRPSVKWGEYGLAGWVRTKFRTSKTDRFTCMSRLLDFRKRSGEALKTHSAPLKTRPCSRFSVFKVLNFVPTLPASPDSPHFTVPILYVYSRVERNCFFLSFFWVLKKFCILWALFSLSKK